ncbi:MAG: hypothetical protein ACREOM_09865, partial [Candidatus Dormibacteraceae bacterium]
MTAVIAPVAYMAMFSGFRLYDDEGFFLITLRDFVSGRPLLAPNNPLYGPFFYEVVGGLFKLLDIAPGHDSGRFVTLSFWLLATLIGGVAVFRLTRNLWLALGAQMVTFSVLIALSDEPSSTYGLISVLLQGLICAAAFRSKWPRATAALIGGIVGALCLIKINVGAFAALAVVFAWACSLRNPARQRAVGLLGALMVAAPAVLVRAFLNQDWAVEFALLVGLSAATIGVAGVMRPPRRPWPLHSGWLMAGGTIVIVISLGIAAAGGTTLADTGNMLAISLRFAGVFVVPLTTGVVYDVWAAVSVVAAFVIFRGLLGDSERFAAVLGLVRVAAGLYTVLLLLTLPEPIFLLGLPLVWLAAVPPRREAGDDPSNSYGRLLLPALAVMESLQAFPIAGSQLSLAALALIPVGFVTLNDGLRELRAATPGFLQLQIAARSTVVPAVP